jgi:O-antigen biosynthesis protein WbqP
MEKTQSTMASSTPSLDNLNSSVPARRASKFENLAKRTTDLALAISLLPLLTLPMLLIALAVKFTSKGPVLYWSDRVGRDNKIFRMPKFRTMHLETPEVATHLLDNPEVCLTIIGFFLRKTSLDELPQIYNILKGDLSFVGPRPALHNQDDLVALRTELGVHALIPGLTGWAQVNGRDNLSITAKVKYDSEYLQKRTLFFDLKILGLTFLRVIRGDGVTH